MIPSLVVVMYPSFPSSPPAPRLEIFRGPENPTPAQTDVDSTPDDAAPCQLSRQFLTVLERLTGWKAEFQESPESRRCRKSGPPGRHPSRGNFRVVDMSPDWPARTPTAHRGHCDQLVDLFSQLVDEVQDLRTELLRTQSALEAYAPGTVPEEAELIDTFLPRISSADDNEREEAQPTAASSPGDRQPGSTAPAATNVAVDPPVGLHPTTVWNATSDWEMDGVTGIRDSVYLDVCVSDDRPRVCLGRLESQFGLGDSEATLEIDPQLEQYRIHGEPQLQSFWLWDGRNHRLRSADTSGVWAPIPRFTALVASTAQTLAIPAPAVARLDHPVSAGQLATRIHQLIDPAEKVLVIQRRHVDA